MRRYIVVKDGRFLTSQGRGYMWTANREFTYVFSVLADAEQAAHSEGGEVEAW